ncbi:serine/threonine-protein kinase [Nevskia ramosa]|uniref:serine/threonine-protein kinase n=1 Tax=Nevskia ramosa TaxID=64002 RepID=UPI0023559581|nr:serine/threonine-protein kinase [Nevskia ramosa]
MVEADNDAMPARIGPYRILRLLGEGSHGRVYLAEESDPPRRIALKVLRAAGAGEDLRRRFRREIELLAALEHPGIARLYAAGVADSDAGPLPWLAMEYIEGQDLLAYADSAKLDLRERLALLAEISRIVHFAHTRGVVHRDLKPANLLVDASRKPRVLDFGIAHLVLDEATPMTRVGQVLGTVPYMSAEQLAGTDRADPRNDVYSLGVIAYELLCGHLPYPGLSKSTVLEALAMIRAGRIERLSQHLPAARGDTETVVMKAMAQESAHRYGSAAELAGDLDRLLLSQPIEARPPTAGYLAGLFVRRHKAITAAAVIAVLALVGGAAVAIRYGLAEAEARQQADARSAEAEAVNAFLEKMLTAATPDEELGRDLRVREVLDSARASLGAERNEALSSTLYRTLGASYLALADSDTALTLLDEARRRAIASYGADSTQARAAKLLHAEALVQKNQLAEAGSEIADITTATQPELDARKQALRARRLQGTIQREQGQFAEAEKIWADVHADALKLLGPDDDFTLTVAGDHAVALQDNGDLKGARAEQEQLLEQQTQRLGPDHPDTLTARSSLAATTAYLGDLPAAVAMMREVVAGMRKTFGDTHPETLTAMGNLGAMLNDTGAEAEGLKLSQEVLDARLRHLGPASRNSIDAYTTVGVAQAALGQSDAAEKTFRTALAAADTQPQALAESALLVRANLSSLLMKLNRLAEARHELELTVASSIAIKGKDNWQTAASQSLYGECLFRLRDLPAAEAAQQAALTAFTATLGPEHDRSQLARERLQKVLLAEGKADQAAALAPAKAPAVTP